MTCYAEFRPTTSRRPKIDLMYTLHFKFFFIPATRCDVGSRSDSRSPRGVWCTISAQSRRAGQAGRTRAGRDSPTTEMAYRLGKMLVPSLLLLPPHIFAADHDLALQHELTLPCPQVQLGQEGKKGRVAEGAATERERECCSCHSRPPLRFVPIRFQSRAVAGSRGLRDFHAWRPRPPTKEAARLGRLIAAPALPGQTSPLVGQRRCPLGLRPASAGSGRGLGPLSRRALHEWGHPVRRERVEIFAHTRLC